MEMTHFNLQAQIDEMIAAKDCGRIVDLTDEIVKDNSEEMMRMHYESFDNVHMSSQKRKS